MESPINTRHIPESILAEVLARLPLRSISRFKSVCKTWKSTLESRYFRLRFVSLHKNSSSSWSIISRHREEFINLHGCRTWGLPKSIPSYIPNIVKGKYQYYELTYSNGLVLIDGTIDTSLIFVGNPILQQWIQIPPPPDDKKTSRFSFVTRLDEDGIVLSFKVLRISELTADLPTCFCVHMYSSETGLWTEREFHFPQHYDVATNQVLTSLNGTVYLSASASEYDLVIPRELVIAHDFYGESNLYRVILLPEHTLCPDRLIGRAFTTSRGFVIYIKTLVDERGDVFLKVWRLNNDDDSWQILSEIRLPIDDKGYWSPLAMHPLDCTIVYLWKKHNGHVVSFNLHNQNYQVLGDGGSTPQNDGGNHHQLIFDSRGRNRRIFPLVLHQFVLPGWMETMPHPPQVEMIDTTSLLSHITTSHKRKRLHGFEVM